MTTRYCKKDFERKAFGNAEERNLAKRILAENDEIGLIIDRICELDDGGFLRPCGCVLYSPSGERENHIAVVRRGCGCEIELWVSHLKSLSALNIELHCNGEAVWFVDWDGMPTRPNDRILAMRMFLKEWDSFKMSFNEEMEMFQME